MSQIKFSPNLFLEQQELTRLVQFLDDDGWRLALLKNSISFGLVDNSIDGLFDNFRVEQGTNAGTYKHAEGFAIDQDGKFIRKAATDNLAIPDDDTWYYIKISHQFSNLEVGTVDIDSAGNVTGTSTFFTEVLRGQPNIAAKVKFSNATLNTGEYDVLEVVDDENVILSGTSFQAETDLTYVVVGSFTPDASPSAGEKDIFNYDSVILTLQTSSTKTAGTEFFIGRVKNNGGVISIEDRRTEIYATKSDFALTDIDESANALIGVEAVKFNHPFTPKDLNQVLLAWNFRSDNWTYQTELNQVTLNAGLGGKFKLTTDFTDGDFDGWRLYTEDGKHSVIRASTKSGSQINLILGSLDPDSFSGNPAQELVITPDVEEIEIHCIPDPADTTDLPEGRFTFPIKLAFARIPLLAYKNPAASYNIAYRYKNNGRYTALTVIPSDTAGFLAESSFDANGTQILTNRSPYTAHATNGFIPLTLNPLAYSQFEATIDADIKQVDTILLDDLTPVTTLEAGVSDRYQRIISAGPLTITVDHFVNLQTAGALNGSTFFLKFEANVTTPLGARKIQIVQDYVNPGDPGQLLTDIVDRIITDGVAGDYVLLRYDYDGSNWIPWEGITYYGQATAGYTANRALATDASGNIVVNATTDAELAYLSGVTSAIQAQIDGKQATVTGAATTIVSSNLTANRALLSDGSGKVVVSAIVSNTELEYLDGVTGAIQGQIDSKQPTITGAATTIDDTDLTIDRAVISDGSGKVAVSLVTAAELGYLDGVTSAIQTQLNGKQPTITGAATTIDDTDLAVSRAVVSDASGKVAVSAVTSAEIAHLDGVTSAIQTQFNDITAALDGLKFDQIDVTNWNCTTTAQKVIAHGITSGEANIKAVFVKMIDDNGAVYDFVAGNGTSSGTPGMKWDDTNLTLNLIGVNYFDIGTEWDAATGTRAKVTICYI